MAELRRGAVVRAHGHPSLRATHAKTLELTTESSVTARATCVVGVGAQFDLVELSLLRGPVAVRLAAGGHELSGTGLINPDHVVKDRIVLRRSDTRDGDTLVTGCTLTADQLDRAFAAGLADPEAQVTLTVTETGRPKPLVLLRDRRSPEPAGRLGLLWRQASPDSGITAVTLDGPPTVGRIGTRYALAAPDTSPWLIGPALALLAAGLPVSPALWLGRLDPRTARKPDVAGLLRTAPPVPLVLAVAGDAEMLAPIAAALGDHAVAVETDRGDVGLSMHWTTARDLVAAVQAVGGDDVAVVLAASVPDDRQVSLQGVVERLTAAGISARTLSEALKPLGVERKTLYASISTSTSSS